MFAPVRVTALRDIELPVNADDARAQLRLDDEDDDLLIDAMIRAATEHLDGWTGILGRALMPQTWRQDYACFEDRLSLPLFPLISVTSVKYYDANAVQQTFSPASYEVLTDALGSYVARLRNASWPSSIDTNRQVPVSVTYQAGYADAANVPMPIKQAILLMVGNFYENREAVNVGNMVTEIPLGAQHLIAPYRRIGF